jgi:hypothetical protein
MTMVETEPRIGRVLPRSVARQVRWQYAQRIRGDYRTDKAVSSLAAHTSVRLAEQIVNRVEWRLRAQHR